MKRFLLGLVVAISLPVLAASLWPSGPWLETFQNGFLFGNGKILSVLNGVITFDDKRLDDRSKNIYFQEDFEGESVSFTCDANLTASDETGSPISGLTSKLITQSAGALGQKCSSGNIDLDEKQKGTLLSFCMTAIGENFDLVGYDVTNSKELVRVAFTSKSQEYCAYFNTLSSTNQIRYDLEARLEVVSSTLKFDDVQGLVNPLTPTDIYASSEWESFTPTCTHTTNTLTESSKWKRDGDDMLIRWRIIYGGAPNAANLECDIPSGYTIDTNKLATAGNNDGSLGRFTAWDGSAGSGSNGTIHYLDTNTLSFFSTIVSTTYTDLTNVTATTPITFGSSDGIFGYTRVPIAGWSNTSQGVVVKNRTDSASVENVFSARIQNNGTASVISQSTDFIESVVRNSNGFVTINFKSGTFSVAPNVTVGSSNNNMFSNHDALSTTSVDIRTYNTSGVIDQPFNITVTRQGTDYIKETDKVYTVPVGFKESRSYHTGYGDNFWNGTGTQEQWDESLLGDLSADGLIEVTFGATSTGTNADRIIALQPIDINISAGCDVAAGGAIQIYDDTTTSLGNALILQGNVSGRDFANASVTKKLNTGEYVWIRCSSSVNRDGYLNIWAKPSKEEGVWLGTFGQPTCYVKDVKANNTAGGTFTSGAWQTRDLNTTEGDCSFLSVSSNQITLEAGTYDIDGYAPAQFVNFHKTKVRNITDSLDQIVGGSARADDAAGTVAMQTNSVFKGKIVLSESKTFEIQHRCSLTAVNSGFGVASNFGVNEVYTQVKITKVR